MKFKIQNKTLALVAVITIALTTSSFIPPAETSFSKFTSVDLGNCKAGKTIITSDGKGVQLQGYGTMFGMHHGSDEGRFIYTKIKGDFDIIVQVNNVFSATEAYAEGGLMVRKDLDPKGLMVANFVSCNNYKGENDQYTFMFRTKAGGCLEPFWDMSIENFYGDHTFGNPGFGYSPRGWSKDNTPARPYPYVWLRIIRQGNKYSGYRRFGNKQDWGKWEKMSETTIELGDEPLVGLALSANHHSITSGPNAGDPGSMSQLEIASMDLYK